MENVKMLSFGMKWDYKTVGFLVFLVILPNLLSMVNISTTHGFKLHTFQVAIILAASIYGPVGGVLSGLFGSTYSAIMMANPYIIGGNIILGFFTGLFIRYGYNVIPAVFMAFGIQIPWLIMTDYYLIHMPMGVITMLIFALAVSNLIWATTAHYSKDRIKSMFT